MFNYAAHATAAAMRQHAIFRENEKHRREARQYNIDRQEEAEATCRSIKRANAIDSTCRDTTLVLTHEE